MNRTSAVAVRIQAVSPALVPMSAKAGAENAAHSSESTPKRAAVELCPNVSSLIQFTRVNLPSTRVYWFGKNRVRVRRTAKLFKGAGHPWDQLCLIYGLV